MNIELKKYDESYQNDAISLFKNMYLELVYAIPYLPKDDEMMKQIDISIQHIFKYGSGVMAFMDKKLVGYFFGYSVPQLFGPVKGIYSPMVGHAANKEYRRLIYAKMLEFSLKIWVDQGYLSFVTTLLAHDKGVLEEFNITGFGMRCMDSIRKTSRINTCVDDVIIHKAEVKDLVDISVLHQYHHEYYRSSPIFMPREPEDALADLNEWMSHENHHLWIAKKDNQAIGYIRIQPNGESIVSHNHQVMNVTGLYVSEVYRNSGVASLLLDVVQQFLIEQKVDLCGVDFETLNQRAYQFWNRYFIPYTMSVARRIDERVVS